MIPVVNVIMSAHVLLKIPTMLVKPTRPPFELVSSFRTSEASAVRKSIS